uniref:Gamma-soluble NSF attachment protein n=1 Tax=Panagrolaimus sp. JU765 TaxID=591449 RepID=A0AC34QIQ0_9BILA
MSMSANEKRIIEAQECENKAKELLKTSIWKMKTKPDYDSAAYEYDRAAVCYKNAEKLDLCLQMYLKSSECHGLNKNLFHEAKAKEAAAFVARDMKNMDQAGKLFKEAADKYLHSGVMDTAASTIDKAAKLMETNDEKVAIELYEFASTIDKAAKLMETNDEKVAVEFLKTSIWKMKTKPDYDSAAYEYDRAAVCYKNAEKLDLCLQIVDDVNFSEERSLANSLVSAYEKGDEKKLQELLTRGYLRAMDNEYLRLLKLVHVPEKKRRATADEGPSLIDDEEELEEGALC